MIVYWNIYREIQEKVNKKEKTKEQWKGSSNDFRKIYNWRCWECVVKCVVLFVCLFFNTFIDWALSFQENLKKRYKQLSGILTHIFLSENPALGTKMRMSKYIPFIYMFILYHRITEWLGLEGTSRIMKLQSPHHRQGHRPPQWILDQPAQGPIQPGLEHLHMYAHIHKYMYTHMHIHIYTCVYTAWRKIQNIHSILQYSTCLAIVYTNIQGREACIHKYNP